MSETEQEREETQATATDVADNALGFLVFAVFLYFAGVFWQLPEGAARWVVTAGVVVAAVALYVAARKRNAIAAKLPVFLRWGRGMSDFLVFAVVVAGIVLAAIYLADEDKVVLLKILTVVYFSLLPALLYLQFSSRRTLAIWKDFVSNLYKLQIDDPANLPRPPTLSRFYPAWRVAREAAWDAGDVTTPPGSTKARVQEDLDLSNQYRQKFRDLFGVVSSGTEPKSVLAINSPHKLQVVMATILITLGWVFVVQPESVFERTFAPNDFELANLPSVPTQTFAFAFLGAYFYILQMLVRRYFQNDLKSTAYINATMRIVIVILLVWVIDPLLSDLTQAQRSALAFVIGVFPTVGWQLLEQVLVRKPIGKVVDSLEPKHKLGDLDGLNIWYESRLLEVGVEDMQNLATTDIVDLMLNTRIPVDRMIDWIDQSLLYVRVTDERERAFLRTYGIRNATDLDDVLQDTTKLEGIDRLLNLDDQLPSRLLAVHAAIETERNLQHVRAWKRFKVAEPWVAAPGGRPVRESAQEEQSPAAAPVPA